MAMMGLRGTLEIIFFVDREARYDNTIITVAFMVSLVFVFNEVTGARNQTTDH